MHCGLIEEASDTCLPVQCANRNHAGPNINTIDTISYSFKLTINNQFIFTCSVVIQEDEREGWVVLLLVFGIQCREAVTIIHIRRLDCSRVSAAGVLQCRPTLICDGWGKNRTQNVYGFVSPF